MSRARRVVIVATGPPVPKTNYPVMGRWASILLKELTARGHRVTLLAPYERAEQKDEALALFPGKDYDLRLHPVSAPNGLRGKWKTLWEPSGYIFSLALRQDLARALEAPWDILHLEEAWSGWLGLPYERRKVLVNFHSLYREDDKAMAAGNWKEALMRRLRWRAEAAIARSYPTLMAVTPRLARDVESLAPGARVHFCPTGLDPELYPFIPASRRAAEPVVALIGSLRWTPTRQAAERLLGKLWPAISARLPRARCLVVGWGAREALSRHLRLPGVEIVENVPDTRPYFERCSLLLYAPTIGTGLKIKVLEAFALGIPVVTNGQGIEGIEARDGVHVELSETDENLVEKALLLLNDPDLQNARRSAARELLERCFAPRPLIDNVERIYDEIR